MDVAKMKVTELKKELKLRGLSADGTKADLVERLQEALISTDKDDSAEDLLNEDLHDADKLLDDEKDDDIEKIEEPLKEKERSPSPKRKLNRSIAPPTTAEIKTTEEPAETVEANPPTTILTEEERKKQRAAKFGLPEPDTADKKADRAARFQLETNGNGTAGKDSEDVFQKRAEKFGLPLKLASTAVETDEKKKTRAERFGLKEEAPTVVPESSDKKLKRSERFGVSVSDSTTDEKKKSRAEKFGEVVALAPAATKRPADSAEIEEKKRRRAERFKQP